METGNYIDINNIISLQKLAWNLLTNTKEKDIYKEGGENRDSRIGRIRYGLSGGFGGCKFCWMFRKV